MGVAVISRAAPCQLSIGYPQRGGQRRVKIEIEDSISGTRIVALEIDLTQWALALTALQARPAMMEFRPDAFGKIPELKIEHVPIKGRAYAIGPDEAKAACAQFCVDGWKPRLSDYGNLHRRSNGGYSVLFYRYVDPTPETLAERYKRFNESLELEGLPPVEVPKGGAK